MQSLPFTLRQLELFISLTETSSFRRTADIMGISQASVSSQVKSLEEQLGFALFNRRAGAQPSLTEDGLAFLYDVRLFEQAAKQVAQHRRRAPSKTKLQCDVFIGRRLLDAYVKPKLDSLLAEMPDLNLSFEARLPWDWSADLVEFDRFDFALFHQRAHWSKPEGMKILRTFRGGVYGHPKFVPAGQIDLPSEAICHLPFILPPESSPENEHVRRVLRQYGIQPRNVVCHTPYHEVQLAMVERGLGVTCLTESQIRRDQEGAPVELFKMGDWHLFWMDAPRLKHPRLRRVGEFLKDCVVADPNYL